MCRLRDTVARQRNLDGVRWVKYRGQSEIEWSVFTTKLKTPCRGATGRHVFVAMQQNSATRNKARTRKYYASVHRQITT